MAKNIVFCADGTWNGPGQDDDHDRTGHPTNVFKLFCNLDGTQSSGTLNLADEQEQTLTAGDGTVRQAAKYLHGVGDSDNFLVKALGGAGGAGLITRVVRGYTFVSRNYGQGDRIFLIGFSRGAYTARALAGLIVSRGLLDGTATDLSDKERAYRLGSSEWFEYRRKSLQSEPNLFGKLQEIAFDLPGFLTKPPTAARLTNVAIGAVAVWDTVGSLGIPEYNLKTDTQLDTFQFANRALSPLVQKGLHAVAVDEQRGSFTPTLWDPDPRISQVLFPGAHSDVGGGYPESGNESCLSDGGLRWMMDGLARLQVVFGSALKFVPEPDPCGMSHRPWMEAPWSLLPRGIRQFPTGLSLHRSVLSRIRGGPLLTRLQQAPYNPENLASSYIVAQDARDGVTIVD